jgi:DNA invertase Pin-like site-specific DNA recombinase
VSTDRQEYSIENQADGIAQYASEREFSIVKTYIDAAKSGLALKNRSGLKQLLKDVVEGDVTFKAILVYDVSRWGRFQDADESAHYEYLCKSAGVPVHYCAESFENDNSMPGLIMKTLKRTMAGEYSRELSVKTRTGLARLAQKGFKPGGLAPYGLRRMLLDSAGKPKKLLVSGDRKCIATERVVLVPGPSEEIAVVKRIFREFAEEHRSLRSIATRLNKERIPFLDGGGWSPNTVTHLLKRPCYIGNLVWGRTTALLGSRVKPIPPKDWTVRFGAFEAIIEEELFLKAQAAFLNLTCRLSDEDMIERLRAILKVEGKLSSEIIRKSGTCPGITTYHNRIGGLLNAYRQLGYLQPNVAAHISSRQRMMLVRREIMKSVVDDSSGHIRESRKSERFRALLRCTKTGLLISVVLARCYRTAKHGLRWILETPKQERKRPAVLALMNESNSCVQELRLFRRMPSKPIAMHVDGGSEWLASGLPLRQPSELWTAIRDLRTRKSPVFSQNM